MSPPWENQKLAPMILPFMFLVSFDKGLKNWMIKIFGKIEHTVKSCTLPNTTACTLPHSAVGIIILFTLK